MDNGFTLSIRHGVSAIVKVAQVLDAERSGVRAGDPGSNGVKVTVQRNSDLAVLKRRDILSGSAPTIFVDMKIPHAFQCFEVVLLGHTVHNSTRRIVRRSCVMDLKL
ncbi:hypothetical protein D3C75_1001580 [compost metagenome]